ncbi:MAG: hypothetical protein MJ148_01060 [Clostridia bacterium]|nr:hypothetical protein [Clostridia bacterium]
MQELLTGLTDIPIAILSLIFTILLARKTSRNFDGYMTFALICFSSILGTIAHTTNLTGAAYKWLWAVLFVFLFESIRWGSFLIMSGIDPGVRKHTTKAIIVEAWLYLFALILILTNKPRPYYLYFLVAFAVVMVVWTIVLIVKSKKYTKYHIIMLASGAIAALFQALTEVVPYAESIEHIFIMIAMAALYLIAKENCKNFNE